MSFLFGGNTGETPESLARRRAMANAMLTNATSRAPRNVGEGLNAIGQAIAGRALSGRVERDEQAAREQANSEFAPILAALSGQSPSMPSPGAQSGSTGGLPSSLIQSESGGDFAAFNDIPGSGGVGHFGRGQFSQGRLQDAMNAGVIPQGTTPDQFLADPQMQQSVEQWHVGDVQNFIDQNNLGRFVGQSIGGAEVTPNGMLAVAHLGGNTGLQQFLESGGQYNPADANGTSLSDYLAMHGGEGTRAPQAASQGGSGLSMAELMRVSENPFLTDGQRQIVGALLQQRMQAGDPMRQLQLERERLEIDRLRNPQPDVPSSVTALQMRAQMAGLQPGTEDYTQFMISGGRGPLVEVHNGQGEVGTIPQGYELFTDPQTGARSMRPITGGPEDTTVTDQARRESTAQQANIVLEDIGRIRTMVTNGGLPTTGLVGSALSIVPGTEAHDVSHLARTIRSNIGFDRLDQMRQASPTGGALGNVTVQEIERLESVLGALGQSQTQEQFLHNLNRLEQIYTGILEKAAAYPNAAEFGFQPIANDEFTGMSRDGLLNMDLNDMSEDQLRRWMQRMDEFDNE